MNFIIASLNAPEYSAISIENGYQLERRTNGTEQEQRVKHRLQEKKKAFLNSGDSSLSHKVRKYFVFGEEQLL